MRLNSFVESPLQCERVCKQVVTQFLNMTSQFVVRHWWTCESWCFGAWSVAGSCSKGRTVPFAYWGSCWIRRCRYAVLAPAGCDMRLVGGDSQSITEYRHQLVDLVANWKLGRDKTKLSSHRISRQDKTAKKLNMFSFEIFCLRQSWLSPIQFTPPTATEQNKTILSCLCRRCELGIQQNDEYSHRFDVEEENLEVECRNERHVCCQAPVYTDISRYDRPNWSWREYLTLRHFAHLSTNVRGGPLKLGRFTVLYNSSKS